MICSGKGGTGKSTVSVLLGAGLARLGRKVLLVELDSGLRSVDIIAGVYGRTVYDIEDVLCGRCEPAKAIVPSPLYAGLSVISAPYEGGEVAAVPLGRLLQAVRPYFDLVMNRVTRDSFGKRASVEDLDECIDTVGAQLIAVIPESVALQQAGAAGTVPPAHDAAVVAGQALAKRLCGQRVPLTF